jgi:peptidoglycan/LPS O-acetylase OafA/YrhL
MDQPKYFPQLDGLRALAVITVMIGHFCGDTTLSKFVGYGDTGVVIFFCLSGFLITGILLDLKELPQNRGRLLLVFYARRMLRIFPIYYLVIAIAVVAGSAPVIAALPRLLTYTANYVPGLPVIRDLGPFPHLWSLSVEEQFYVAWPALIFLVPRRFLPAAILAVVCSSAAFKVFGTLSGASNYVLFRSVFSCMDSLAAGAALALLRPILPRIFDTLGSRILAGSIALVGALTAVRFWVDADPWYRGHELLGVIYFQSIILLSCAAIMASVSGKRWLLTTALESSPLVYIGRISYGLYIYHYVMPYVAAVLVPRYLYTRFPTLTLVVLSLAAASLSWFIVEKRFLSLKRFFPYDAGPFSTQQHGLGVREDAVSSGHIQ